VPETYLAECKILWKDALSRPANPDDKHICPDDATQYCNMIKLGHLFPENCRNYMTILKEKFPQLFDEAMKLPGDFHTIRINDLVGSYEVYSVLNIPGYEIGDKTFVSQLKRRVVTPAMQLRIWDQKAVPDAKADHPFVIAMLELRNAVRNFESLAQKLYNQYHEIEKATHAMPPLTAEELKSMHAFLRKVNGILLEESHALKLEMDQLQLDMNSLKKGKP